MNRLICVACVLAVLAGGCGSKDEADVAGDSNPAPKPAPSGEATAEEVAREMRGSVRCPARASTAQPAGAPVVDVVGVRPGMSWDEAVNFVLCDNPMMVINENTGRNYGINTFGQRLRQGFEGTFAQPRVVKSSRDYLREMGEEAARRSGNAVVERLQPGQSRFYVSTMGMPGQERVISVAREEYFADGKQPTIDNLKQALVAKYGPPSEVNDTPPAFQMWWEYDPAGNKISQQSCRISVGPDAATSLSTECGLAVGAMIQSSRTNAGLARSLAVSSQDGATGYELIQRTEESLRAADAARKAKELNDAAKNAATPRL
jgi:hypothetical protein